MEETMTATITPASPERLAEMRAQATETRQAQRDVCARLAAGEVRLVSVLADGATAPVERMRVLRLLKALPGVGDAKARRAMDQARVPHTRRVSGLDAQHRSRLLVAIDAG
jgi:putative heme degradation protein